MCYTAGSGVKTVRSDPVTDLQHLSDLEHSLYLPQEFLGAAVRNNHGWGGLRTTEVYSLTVLEARSPK